MPVSDQHPEFEKYEPQWQKTRDCVEGPSAVKARGVTYLPMPNPDDQSNENKSRYNAYKARANFVNFTKHTKTGMVGLVFRKPMKSELPSNIEYLKDDATGGGLSLEQLVKSVLGGILETGRDGLLVDYPAAEEGLTAAQVRDMDLRANILNYPAESIINWDTEVINGVRKLSLVVLKEPHKKYAEDGFSYEQVTWYRVLWKPNGSYMQSLFDEDYNPVTEFVPRKADGSLWSEIPFIFVGAENNDETVDEAPLYDMAEINLAHYRNSADYEESSFMVGQPVLTVAGLNETWVKDVLGGTVNLGSRGIIPLPVGGDAKLLQANPNQMPAEGMKDKEAQMIKIGARIIQDNTGNETAEAAKIRFAGQNSQLASIVGNITDALAKCIGWIFEFMGGESGFELEINTHFYDVTLDAQQVMAMIQLADRGDIAKTDVRDNLRKTGWLRSDKTDEEIDEENLSNPATIL